MLVFFAGLHAWGQGYVPFANSVNKKDTARTTLSLRVDSAVRLPKYANTDTTKVLSLDGGGNLVWRTKGTPLSVSSPLVFSSNNISVNQAGASMNGYVSSTDWNTFNNKLGNALTSAYLFVGNGSNVATAVAMSGDASISNAGAVTLAASGVSAGTYAYVTVDAKGRVTGGIPMASQTLTDGTFITWNVSNGTNAAVTLHGSRTLAFSGILAGEYLTLEVIQDSTGSHTLTYPGGTKSSGGGLPILTATAGAKDVLCFYYDGSSYWITQPITNGQ
jgi:phage-related tail fiber protein